MATLRFGSKIICPIKLISDIALKSLSAIPSNTVQVFTTPQSEAYNKIVVSGVTAIVDQNIIPENIKQGVTILEVEGTYTNKPNQYCIEKTLDSNGTLHLKYNSTFSLNDITCIDVGGLAFSNYKNTLLTGNLDLSSLMDVKESSLYSTFQDCTNLESVDLSNLTTVSGSYAFKYTFCGCINLKSVNLSSLTTISGGYAFDNTFNNCINLKKIYFPALNKIPSGKSFNGSLYGCTNIEDVYFPSLTDTSFGNNTNQFIALLGKTNTSIIHTLHFPANLESKIQTLDEYPEFGGTSDYVVLAYDMPGHVRYTEGDLVYDSITESYIPISAA